MTIELRYDPDTGLIHRSGYTRPVNRKFNGPTKGNLHHQGYRRIKVNGREHFVHRLAFELMDIEIPDGYEVDHINGDKEDNRWENLRLVTRRENQQNQKRHREGGLPGTHFDKKLNKWLAYYSAHGKRNHIGVFKTEKEAHEAYLTAIKDL